jgi:glucokinase
VQESAAGAHHRHRVDAGVGDAAGEHGHHRRHGGVERLGNAGHIGHIVVEPEGRDCRCGGRGCLEAYCSGQAIEEETGRPPQRAPQAIVERTGLLTGRALASLAAICDLRLAVVGGSVALGFGEPFFSATQLELDQRARLSFTSGFRVVPAGLGQLAPLVGAAALARRAGPR